MSATALFVYDYSITGGVERVNANLANLFLKNNIECSFIISLRSVHDTPEIKFPDHLVPVILFKNEKEKNISGKLESTLRQHNITTLIFQGDNMTIVLEVQKAARQANCRSVLHYHGSPYGYLRKYIYREDIIANPLNIFKLLWSRIVYPFKKAKLRKVITNATGGFVCVSEGVRKELLELCSLPGNLEKNIWSIPNPLTFDRNETINLQKKYMVVYISRLHRKHKNSMMAVKAWALIEKKFPGWQLYILGDGVLRSAMEKFCTQHQLLHVHFTGMVSNVKEYVRDSSVSILTSDCEGLGMGLLESASYKNALLVTNADGGVSDIVVDGSTGFMVERNDVKLFAERLSTLMSDELLRKKMGDAAFKRLENFDDAVIVARWMQLLKPII